MNIEKTCKVHGECLSCGGTNDLVEWSRETPKEKTAKGMGGDYTLIALKPCMTNFIHTN